VRDGRGTPVPGEYRSVDVDAAPLREFKQPGWENPTIGGDHHQVWLVLSQGLPGLLALHFGGLEDRKVMGLGGELHRRGGELSPSASGAVWLGDDRLNLTQVRACYERL